MGNAFEYSQPRTWEELLVLRDFLTDCDVAFLRRSEDHKKYQNDMNLMDRDEGIKLITDQFQGRDRALIPNKYPHTNLLQHIPNVMHYCLWSLKGALTEMEIKQEVENFFPSKRWTSMTRKSGYFSIPEIWHTHIYVEG